MPSWKGGGARSSLNQLLKLDAARTPSSMTFAMVDGLCSCCPRAVSFKTTLTNEGRWNGLNPQFQTFKVTPKKKLYLTVMYSCVHFILTLPSLLSKCCSWLNNCCKRWGKWSVLLRSQITLDLFLWVCGSRCLLFLPSLLVRENLGYNQTEDRFCANPPTDGSD